MKDKSDILTELEGLSSTLLALKNLDAPCVVPKDYFGNLLEQVENKIDTQSSILSNLQKTTPVVPDKYFEKFSNILLSKINHKKNKSYLSANIPSRKNRIFSIVNYMAVAAAIIGVVLLINKTQQPALPKNNCTDGVACLTRNEIYNYMREHSHEFEEQDIKKAVLPALETNQRLDNNSNNANSNIEQDDLATDIF